MKNVLFYYDNYCDPSSKGGTEVATWRIAKALKNTGKFNVFNAFRNSATFNEDNDVYSTVIKLDKNKNSFIKKLASFIRENQIDYVVNMGRFFRHNPLSQAITLSGRESRLIFMHHFAPGSELKKSRYSSGFRLLKLNPLNPLYWLRATVYPLIKLPRTLKLPEIYKKIYDLSDKVVLLSEGYKNDFCKIGRFSSQEKFVAIPNIFETKKINNEVSPDFLLGSKKNRVLILSRMDEIQKRISTALKIWKKIEGDSDLSHWHLDIVGSGHNTDIVKRCIRRLKLKNVTYHGWQKSESFLREDSILMSTSDYEGLSLAMIEAMAYGCVPIAYDSYASLKDVILPELNGVMIKEINDIDSFYRQLSLLMKDDTKRQSLATQAMERASNFSSQKIAEQWCRILI